MQVTPDPLQNLTILAFSPNHPHRKWDIVVVLKCFPLNTYVIQHILLYLLPIISNFYWYFALYYLCHFLSDYSRIKKNGHFKNTLNLVNFCSFICLFYKYFLLIWCLSFTLKTWQFMGHVAIHWVVFINLPFGTLGL